MFLGDPHAFKQNRELFAVGVSHTFAVTSLKNS